MTRLKHHRFTNEQVQYFKDNHFGKYSPDFAIEFNKKFGTKLKPSQIKNFRSRYNLNSGLTGHFPKGHQPMTKGKKQTDYMTKEQIERTKRTRFKKGQKSINERPIGSTRICSKDGYVLVKVKEKGRWQMKHRVVYEEHHGPVPKDMIVTFLDGNKLNIDISNLMLINRRENSLINKIGLRDQDEDLNESGIHLGRLLSKINEYENG